MAAASVEILMNSLKELQVEQPHLLENTKDRVEKLQNYLPHFKTFLRDAPRQCRDDERREGWRELERGRERERERGDNGDWVLELINDGPRQRREDEMLWKLIRSIRDAVYEAEDIIHANKAKRKNYLFSKRITSNKAKRKNYLFHDPFKIFNRYPKQAKSLLEKIADIYRDTRIHYVAGIEDQNGWTKYIKGPQVRKTNVVGFEDEVQRVKGFLFEESQELEAISIVGMPGLGKTTFVGKIFLDPDIQNEFPTRIWVHVSREFTEKDIFLAILKEFATITNDVKSRTEKELAKLAMSYLENRRFLLVMDEVWSTEDWDKLKIALPSTNERGKILITSRWAELGWHVNRRRGPHMLRFLTAEESLLLLQMVVSRRVYISGKWEVEGRLIAEKCGGLALAIVVIGGILVNAEPDSYGMKVFIHSSYMKKEWEDFSDRFDTHFIYEDQVKRMDEIILLNYAKLPNHLRECFLYFGMFPKDFEIPVWNLICLWIAEGFIQEEDAASLEETAENYLDELINRSLVISEKFHANGKVKTCRIHHMLRDFCLNEAGMEREGFLQEVKISNNGKFKHPVSEELTFHRLSIDYSALKKFVSRKPYGPIVRSFVCLFSDERSLITMPASKFSAIPKGFKQLRILHVEPIKLTKLPRDLCQLLHLRYLVLYVKNLKVLPSAFSKLWNIQTLVVSTKGHTLDIKADILNMSQLRHFKTYAAAVLPKASESSKRACEQIQTLGNIAAESCTEDVFDRARNLKKLGVRGKLSFLLDEKSGSFESLAKLSNLENLKLLNDTYLVPFSKVRLRLPPAYKFPPKLKILTLSATFLDWDQMSIIGSLDKLEVLKLKDNAFRGEIWEVTDGGFRHLEVLHIERTNLKIWLASHHHFPRLKHLRLKYCEDLEQVPIKLAHVPSFLKLELNHSKRCAASAKKIEAKIKKNDQYSRTAVRQFRLSIYPPKK